MRQCVEHQGVLCKVGAGASDGWNGVEAAFMRAGRLA